MKNIYLLAATSLCMSMAAAQTIDRSHQPKAGPAPVITINDPNKFILPNGVTVLVVENHSLPKVTANLSIDRGPTLEGKKAGVMQLMGGMMEEGTTTMPKDKFDNAVDQMGADVNLNPSGGSVGALTRYFPKAFALFADALRHPAMPEESFKKLQTRTITGLKTSEKSAAAISRRVVNALSFGTDNAMGEFSTEESVKGITLDDVKAAYKNNITPSRCYLTFIGDITPLAAKALATKELGSWAGVKLAEPSVPAASNVKTTEVDMVDVPNAVQSEITVTNLVNLPMSSPDYFAVLIANQILGGGADARLFMNLREKHGFTYGSYSNVGGGRFQTKFSASASVRNEKTDSAVSEILNELNRIRTEPVSDEELKNAKAIYNGRFALGMENPGNTANYASNVLINNLPKDFYRTYLQKINAVTTADVQRAAQKYFNKADTRIVAVGKAAQIKDGLSKLGFPVKQYDKFAQPYTAPAMVGVASNTTPANAAPKPQEIINNFIKAIGGAEEVAKVNSLNLTGEMSFQGMTMQVTQKKMTPNMDLNEVKMQGITAMKRVFDGTAGSMSQMGNKTVFEADQIAEMKEKKGVIPQLFYGTGYTLENAGTEKVDAADAFKIKVTGPSGKSHNEWYDTKTGYLIKYDAITKMMGQEATQNIVLGSYKKFGNIMLPTTQNISVGPTDFTIEIKDAKINEGVTAEDFK